MEYRNIEENEITCELFAHFNRHQVVTKCWRKIDGEWCIKDIAFVEEWTEEEYEYLVKCLKNTVKTGGLVAGAFVEGQLKGFVSVEPEFLGSKKQYLELSSMHASEDMRGMEKHFLASQNSGQKSMERKNFIYPVIHQ